jgi:hypothetical protein
MVAGNQFDPVLANNSLSIVTTAVGVPVLSVVRVNNSLQLIWPANSGFKLQVTDSLIPASWADVGGTPQVNGNGQNVVAVGVAGSGKFYRLRSP